MKKDCLLGIDFGTGGCKVTVVDSTGHMVESASGEYPSIHPKPAWAEQNPADWYRVMCSVLQGLSCSERIAAVSLDSYTHGAVLLNSRMEVVRPTIIWTDQRSVKECAELKEGGHEDLIFRTAYQCPAPTWTLPQLMWLNNNEPDSIVAASHILFVKDYVRYLMTGEMACDYIEAQGALLWDMKNSCWSKDLCDLAQIDVDILPAIGRPTDIAGKISAQASRDTGLAEGLPVVMGTSDSAVEDYAAGAVNPGQCILKLATAGNVNVMTAEAHPHPRNPDLLARSAWYVVHRDCHQLGSCLSALAARYALRCGNKLQ